MKSFSSILRSMDTGALKLLIVVFGVIFLAGCSDDSANPVTKSPVVLVHGAWQADYVWEQTKANLTSEGYQVSVVNLPGHGNDDTAAASITFQDYVNTVKSTISAYNEPIVLVGHSLGGAIITQTATEVPQKISKLIYVAGFIPESGKSVYEYSIADHGSLLGPALAEPAADGTLGLKDPTTDLANIFCQDCTDAQTQLLLQRYKAEPLPPLGSKLDYKLADFNAAGTKYYIYTTADNAISYTYQQQMATAFGITNSYELETGHSPFISKPTEFTNTLKDIFKN